MEKLRLFIIIGLLTTFFGCATLFTGTSDKVTIQSKPSNAKVFINNEPKGETPLTLELDRDKDYSIVVKKAGYGTGTASLQRQFNPVSLLNFIGVIWWVVDFATGAVWKFEKESIYVTLSQKESKLKTPIIAGDGLKVIDLYGKKAVVLEKNVKN